MKKGFSCELSIIAYRGINSKDRIRLHFIIEDVKKIVIVGDFDVNFMNALSSEIRDGMIVDSFCGKKISMQLVGGYFECMGKMKFSIEECVSIESN